MIAEYFIPILKQSLPVNEQRRLIGLLKNEVDGEQKPKKTNKELRDKLIKHITKKR